MTDEEAAALAEQVKSLQKKVDEATSETKGIQSLIGKWSTEIGKLRDQANSEDNEELKSKLDAMEVELKEMKKSATPPQGGQPSGEGGDSSGQSVRRPPAELADELELSLNEDQRKLVEQAYAQLEDKSQWDDPKYRVAVYEEVKAEVKSVPDSPWRAQRKEPVKADNLRRVVKDLIAETRKKAANVPPGSGGVGYDRGTVKQNERTYTGTGSLGKFLKTGSVA
jgi:DNA repair exonuclease SbcCD ATPase subunit